MCWRGQLKCSKNRTSEAEVMMQGNGSRLDKILSVTSNMGG